MARKTIEKADCSSCKAMFGSLEKPFNLDINPEYFTYFDSINRGGLMFPSNFFKHYTLWVLHFQFVYFKRVIIQISCVIISKTHSYWHHGTLYCKQ